MAGKRTPAIHNTGKHITCLLRQTACLPFHSSLRAALTLLLLPPSRYSACTSCTPCLASSPCLARHAARALSLLLSWRRPSVEEGRSYMCSNNCANQRSASLPFTPPSVLLPNAPGSCFSLLSSLQFRQEEEGRREKGSSRPTRPAFCLSLPHPASFFSSPNCLLLTFSDAFCCYTVEKYGSLLSSGSMTDERGTSQRTHLVY